MDLGRVEGALRWGFGLIAATFLALACSSGGGGDSEDTVDAFRTDQWGGDHCAEQRPWDFGSRDTFDQDDGDETDSGDVGPDTGDEEVITPPDPPRFRVDGRFMLDSEDNVLMLRGVNLSGAAKYAPGHLIDIDETLARDLVAKGVNSVRMLTFWRAVTPEAPGVVDQAYLEAFRARVQTLTDAGIYVIVDVHQDLWGPPFEVHGAPEWACPAALKEGYQPESPWWASYLTTQVSACFDHFWQSTELQEHYGDMLGAVAEVVCDNPLVVGFDIMNEPWPGTLLPDPTFDQRVLMPFYMLVLERVEKVCPGRLFFFEPSGAFTFGLADAMVIPEEVRDRVVIAPHYYPPEVHEPEGAGYGANEQAKEALYADLFDDWGTYLDQGVALWSGEYGAITTVPNIRTYMEDLHEFFSTHFVSSALWDYGKSDGGMAFLDSNGDLKPEFSSVFSTPYPTILPSGPTSLVHNWTTGTTTATVRCRPGGTFTWVCPGESCTCASLYEGQLEEAPSFPGFVSYRCLDDGEVTVTCGIPLTLVDNGTSAYVIVVEGDSSPSERRAAEELRTALLDCCNVDLPVVTDAPDDGTPMIVIGRGEAATQLGIAPTDDELGEQGFVIRTVPPHVVIAGTAAAGTMYGVHRFLEKALEFRWFAPGVTQVKTATTVTVPAMDFLVKPAFLWRHTSYNWPGGDSAFLAHQGDNAGSGDAHHEFGIQHSHDGRAHSYFRFVHPDEFFEDHPEYFSEIGGVRVRDETQLCLTNPEVLDIVTERMLARMASMPHVRQHNFSQHDRYNYCQCEACSAMNEAYGTAGGTQFWFVSELAKRTSQVYPDKLIGTLAYMYTEEPPVGLEMHPNVAVWLCHMYPSCDSHPIATCPHNADYKRRALAWSQLAKHLYIWHYIVDFAHYYNPFPNFRAMASDMRFYRDIGVEGIYLQGMGHSGGGGEFSLLRPFYGMKLLWNPDQNPVHLRTDFLKGYYGAAWDAIHRYIERLHDEVTDKDIHMHLYTNPGQGYLPDEVLDEAGNLFDEAEEAVHDDPEVLERVRVARMPLTYARFFPRNGYSIVGTALKWLGTIASIDEIMEFLGRMDAHGFTTLRELGGETSLMVLIYSMLGSDQEVVSIENQWLKADIVPNLGGRTLRILHKATNQDITAFNRIPNMFFPFAGGMEDRVGGFFEAFGWVEPATVKSSSETHVTLGLTALNGYKVERTLTMDPEHPQIHFQTTITNGSSPRYEDRFRFHLELDLGNIRDTQIRFQSRGNDNHEFGTEEILANMREGIHFYDLDIPAGEWTFEGTTGLTVTQKFNPDEIDFVWLYSFPETLNELEVEVWWPKLHLEPGESRTFACSVEVR
jgi:hypothetical protein